MDRAENPWRLLKPWLFAAMAIVPAWVVAEESYSPYVGQKYPTHVYWGDTHLHTNLSIDAYTYGNSLSPADAYRFARGEAVTANNGMAVKLRRPLDFLAVTDHAENLGVMIGLEARDPTLLKSEAAKRTLQQWEKIKEIQKTDPAKAQTLSWKLLMDTHFNKEGDIGDPAFVQSAWNQVTATADRYNDPGQFTALIGFEWTSEPGGSQSLANIHLLGNLHRNLIFRDGANKASQVVPFSQLDSHDPEDLWAYMADYEKKTAGQVLAIPHNGNTSNGEMFALQTFAGQPLSRSYAEQRRRWEPLYEVTQIKGDSEAHPFLSPTDEFADYETWNSWSIDLPPGRAWNEEESIRKQGEYARSALKRGLGLQAKLGVNPFKFGLIGSTDAHTSLSAVEEKNYTGTAPNFKPSAQRLRAGWKFAASGYAAVWAEENTREALFDAMKRKETYATTGPRMTVRFFGGWDYVLEDAVRPDLALTGYRKGVPMGGDLIHAPKGKSPSFLIRAVKDPDGANLDRVQVIKGWRNEKGELHERIYNVALSDGRKVDEHGRASPAGSTVDVKNATYTNTIGDPELAMVWTDPDFDPKELAFYYVRVLEIPTPRWTAYDAKFFGIEDVPPEVPMVTQERAYTSPIWYSP